MGPEPRQPRHRVAMFMAALAQRTGDRKAVESWMFEVATWCVKGDRRPND